MANNVCKKMYEEWWENRERVDFFSYERNVALAKLFPQTSSELKVLDVACGDGTTAAYLNRQGYKVWGIDISKKAVDKARSLRVGTFRKGNVEGGLPYQTRFFDVVILGDIVEHLLEPENLLTESKRVLKKNGRLILSCPNMGFWLYRWHYFKTGEIPITDGRIKDPWKTGHIRFYTISNIKDMLRNSGFEPGKIVGVHKSRIYKALSRYYPDIFASIIIVESSINNRTR
jgi:methionine biosynthesis protein MetW